MSGLACHGSTIGFHVYSSLFIIVINLIFKFSLNTLTELRAFMVTDFFYVFLY